MTKKDFKIKALLEDVMGEAKGPKDATNYVIKTKEGFYIDSLDPDTEASLYKPGETVSFYDSGEGVKKTGTITQEEMKGHNEIYKIKLVESKKKVVKEAEEKEIKSEDPFTVLDTVRTDLQNAQSALVISIPAKYQTLYQAELGVLYQAMDQTIAGTIELAKKMKSELGI